MARGQSLVLRITSVHARRARRWYKSDAFWAQVARAGIAIANVGHRVIGALARVLVVHERLVRLVRFFCDW